jgi:hypothetical protein
MESRIPQKSFFIFNEIEIPTKFYVNFFEISMFRFPEISNSMLKSEFRFWFWYRNFDFYIGISISTLEFRFGKKSYKTEISTFIEIFSSNRYRYRLKEKGLLTVQCTVGKTFSTKKYFLEFRYRGSKYKSEFRFISIIFIEIPTEIPIEIPIEMRTK